MGIAASFPKSIAGQPEIVFTSIDQHALVTSCIMLILKIGQLETLSTVSGVDEMYGVVVSLIRSKGTLSRFESCLFIKRR